MKNAIIYFFTALFLLFIVESRLNTNTLRNDYASHTSQNLPKKANRLNQTLEKLSVQQRPDYIDNSSLELDDADFQISDAAEAFVVLAGIFGFIFLFRFDCREKLRSNLDQCFADVLSVKRFLFIRSIRI